MKPEPNAHIASQVQSILDRLDDSTTAKLQAKKALQATLDALGINIDQVKRAAFANQPMLVRLTARELMQDLTSSFAGAMEPLKVSMGALDEAIEALQVLLVNVGAMDPADIPKKPHLVPRDPFKTSVGSGSLPPAAQAALDAVAAHESPLSGSIPNPPWLPSDPKVGPKTANPV